MLHRLPEEYGPAEPGRYQVSIADISKEGMGLLSNLPLPRGKIVTIQWESRKKLVATVVHCTRSGNQWKIGCKLREELTDDELEEMTREG